MLREAETAARPSRRLRSVRRGSIQVSHLGWRLPGGAELLRDVSFSVGDGDRAALVGANGVGKSTLMRLIAGELTPTSGTLTIDGRLGVMRQLVGVADGVDDAPPTVRELLVSLAPPALRASAGRLADAERRRRGRPDGATPTRSPTGATTAATTPRCTGTSASPGPSGSALDEVADRPLRTFSGGEQKRIALEVLLRGDDDILLLDEPDNFLDVAGQALARAASCAASRKTVLYVSHDRELLAATATKIVTVEAEGAWTHGGGFAGYAEARRARLEKLSRDRSWYDDERKRLAGARRRDAPAGEDLRHVRAAS